MTKERASMFGEDDDLDVSGFKPQPARRPDAAAVRAVAERSGFPSREPSAAPMTPATPDRPRRSRRKTGRTLQLNVRVSEITLDRFMAIADDLGISQAEAFERAVDALSRNLG